MESLNLAETEDKPKIVLDKQNGIFEISGRSLPEDPADFYRPVLKWVRDYAGHPNPSTEFVFKLEYYNTGSSKIILDLLYELEKIKGARIQWHFHDDDEDMEEAGEEFAELVDVPFEFKVY